MWGLRDLSKGRDQTQNGMYLRKIFGSMYDSNRRERRGIRAREPGGRGKRGRGGEGRVVRRVIMSNFCRSASDFVFVVSPLQSLLFLSLRFGRWFCFHFPLAFLVQPRGQLGFHDNHYLSLSIF